MGAHAASDGELVERIVTGDHDAFAALVRRHEQEVFGLLVLETGSRQRAEDAFQETLVTLNTSAAKIRDPDRVRFWLRRVAVNQVRHRSITRRVNRERSELAALRADDGEMELGCMDRAEDFTERLVHDDDELDTALRALPHDQRRAVWLVDVVGWTHAEVAESYDVSINTVSSWISRGHRRLRDNLGNGEAQ